MLDNSTKGLLRVFPANKESSREGTSLLKEHPHNHEESAAGNTGRKGHSDKVSKENEEHATGNWRKGHFVQKPRT